MFYQRAIFPSLVAHLPKKQITVLTGMRRTGKTTLVKALMEQSPIAQKVYFDLERIDNREFFAEKNYENIVYALAQRGFSLDQPLLIAIDEIQMAPNLPSVVKYLYDTYGFKFILTGSSAYYLRNNFNESLAGRKKLFEVYPLGFGEVLTFNNVPHAPFAGWQQLRYVEADYHRLKHYYESYIRFGGFPEVVLAESEDDKRDLISDILSSYLNYDIAVLADIRKSTDLYKLVKLLSNRIGTRLDISKLTSFTQLSRPTVENYLDLLEQSYLIKTIPVLAQSADREIVKARKIYFTDNGIANFAAELSSGAQFENAVFNQLHPRMQVAYYQQKNGREIDFILDQQRAIEVKETATESDLKTVTDLAQKIGISESYVVGRHPGQVFDGLVWGGMLL
jgi:uncharacterized protein